MDTELFSPLQWDGQVLTLIEQRLLPEREDWVDCKTVQDVADAIRTMVVRGAPAIGCSAAYGMVIAANDLAKRGLDLAAARAALAEAKALLAATRPTAVNLFWALAQTQDVIDAASSDTTALAQALDGCARRIHSDDIEMCRSIGKHGAELVLSKLGANATVLTHCNAGALATGGYGTALGVIRATREAGKNVRVIADETRPFFQGARLTAWELAREDFDVTVIPDSAAAHMIGTAGVDFCVVGADRIAANGDVANKIGTYGVALACRAHGVPFYVAAPRSTIDMATASGADIPIEERAGEELTRVGNVQLAPDNITARYPAFDITPCDLVDAIITDRGVIKKPYGFGLAALMAE